MAVNLFHLCLNFLTYFVVFFCHAFTNDDLRLYMVLQQGTGYIQDCPARSVTFGQLQDNTTQ